MSKQSEIGSDWRQAATGHHNPITVTSPPLKSENLTKKQHEKNRREFFFIIYNRVRLKVYLS